MIAAARRPRKHQRAPQVPVATGVPGSIEIVDHNTQLPITAIALASGETFDLDAIVYDSGIPSLVITGLTVNWSSNAAGVATVNASGVVSYVGNGSATITASVSSGGGTPVVDVAAVTTTGQAAVASVVSSTNAMSGTAGTQATFTVQPKDASGNNLQGRVVTVQSDNTNVATVSISGYTVTVTLVGAGTANVTATCETIPDSTPVAVTVQAAGSLPNLPANYTTVVWSQPWGSMPTGTYVAVPNGTGYHRLESGAASIQSDATAPYTPNSILRTQLSSSLVGGKAPVALEGWVNSNYSSPTAMTKVYISFWVMVGAVGGFQLHRDGQKMGFVAHGTQPGSSRNQSFWILAGSGSNSDPASIVTSVRWQFQTQGPTGASIGVKSSNMNHSAATIPTGTWVQIETVLEINDVGSANGVLKMWRAGVQFMNYSNMIYRTASATRAFWWYNWNPTYGGGIGAGTVRSQTDNILMDHVEIRGI